MESNGPYVQEILDASNGSLGFSKRDYMPPFKCHECLLVNLQQVALP